MSEMVTMLDRLTFLRKKLPKEYRTEMDNATSSGRGPVLEVLVSNQ